MPTSLNQTGTLIIGGGLAGCAAAIVLARAGESVTLLEREQPGRHKVCGEFLSAEALHILASLGLQPDDHGAVPIHTVRLAAAQAMVPSTLPFQARSLSRRCLDGLLLAAARNAGAQVLQGSPVEALSRVGASWHAVLGSGQTIAAPRVVLGTGKHDLRGFPRPRGVQHDLVALKMYLRLRPDQARELDGAVELLLHPHGYTGLQLIEDGAANLTALVRRKHLASLGGWPGLFAEISRSGTHAAQRLRDAQPLLDKPLAISSIPYGFVRREAVAPDIWSVGDQAAVIPSFTGDGMSLALYTGLRAAQSLLAKESAEQFQRGLHGDLRRQVSRATALSRALVHPFTSPLLTAGARLWPGGLRAAAALTRISGQAMSLVPTST